MPGRVSFDDGPDIHLQHLFIETDVAWYLSLKNNVFWLFSRKEPPLEVTSKPIPVEDLWGEYRYGKISAPASILLHAAVIGILLLVGRVTGVIKPAQPVAVVSHNVTDIGAYLPPAPKPAGGGGGGGDRSPEPASKGNPPRFDWVQLTPPMVVLRNPDPKLAAEPTVLGPPDLKLDLPAMTQLGDPLGKFGPPSSGPGAGGGIGSGCCGGVGPGHGAGVGPGELAGFGGGAFRPGFGGVSRPQLLYSVEPEYSDAARKARHQGTVVIYAVVDVDGRIRDMRVMTSVGLGLDERAVEAVKQWKFKPGMKDGRAVPVVASIEVTFRLL